MPILVKLGPNLTLLTLDLSEYRAESLSDLRFGLVTVLRLLILTLLFLYVESEFREISSAEFSGDLDGGFLSFTSTFFFIILDFLIV